MWTGFPFGSLCDPLNTLAIGTEMVPVTEGPWVQTT